MDPSGPISPADCVTFSHVSVSQFVGSMQLFKFKGIALMEWETLPLSPMYALEALSAFHSFAPVLFCSALDFALLC